MPKGPQGRAPPTRRLAPFFTLYRQAAGSASMAACGVA